MHATFVLSLSLSVAVGEAKTLKYPTDYPSLINHIATVDNVSGVRVEGSDVEVCQ